jgi:hypothetical protein
VFYKKKKSGARFLPLMKGQHFICNEGPALYKVGYARFLPAMKDQHFIK